MEIITNLNKYVLGTIPKKDDEEIKRCHLPTKRQVLLCYLYQQQVSSTKREAANKTVSEVLKLYNKARIPTLQYHKMAEEIEKLFSEFTKLNKTQPKDHNTPGKPRQKIDALKWT